VGHSFQLVKTCDLQAMKAENKRGIIGPDSRSWYAKVLINMEEAVGGLARADSYIVEGRVFCIRKFFLPMTAQ
jgi:hypothetical protein